jgi:hypothetical protein
MYPYPSGSAGNCAEGRHKQPACEHGQQHTLPRQSRQEDCVGLCQLQPCARSQGDGRLAGDRVPELLLLLVVVGVGVLAGARPESTVQLGGKGAWSYAHNPSCVRWPVCCATSPAHQTVGVGRLAG